MDWVGLDWIGLKLNGRVWHGLAEWCHSILDANRQMNNKKKQTKKMILWR